MAGFFKKISNFFSSLSDDISKFFNFLFPCYPRHSHSGYEPVSGRSSRDMKNAFKNQSQYGSTGTAPSKTGENKAKAYVPPTNWKSPAESSVVKNPNTLTAAQERERQRNLAKPASMTWGCHYTPTYN